jgi:CheY-like chemotaxis protein
VEISPILILEDDIDDVQMIKDASERLKIERAIHFFHTGDELIAFLQASELSPYFILSDVNLRGETGFDIKKRIADNEQLKYKSVPFIFWSTNASEKQIQYAYDLPVQGFFMKPHSFQELCDTFQIILTYWQKSQHPKRIL